MPLPTEIDLYDWNDYSFYRALIGKPIPSPRVWDNAGRFGFKGGDYMKDIYFEEDLFEPTLYTKKDITNYINEKFGNGLRIKKGKGKLMKADKTNHKLVWTKENNHLYLNLEDFLQVQSFSNDFDIEKIYNAIKEIYLLLDQKRFDLDVGFAAFDDSNVMAPDNSNQKKWVVLNQELQKKLDSNEDPIQCLYEYVFKIFDCPSKKLFELNEVLKNDFWFVDMFAYSFQPRILRWIKQISWEIKDKDKIKQIKDQKSKNENITPITEKRVSEKNKISKKNKFIIIWIFVGLFGSLLVQNLFTSNKKYKSPVIIQQSPNPGIQNPGGLGNNDFCSACKLLGDCSLFPQCTTQSSCRWRIDDITGNVVRDCSGF